MKFVKCWGNGKPVREFLFVEDACEALIEITKSYNDIKPLNVGMGKGYSIKKIAEIIKKQISYNGEIVWDKNMSNGTMKKVLNNREMLKKIKWRATTDIEKGISKTISWYSNSKR
jgi:nucleoside-diphosphate-sugar epimerase